jgi:hypothetical protein
MIIPLSKPIDVAQPQGGSQPISQFKTVVDPAGIGSSLDALGKAMANAGATVDNIILKDKELTLAQERQKQEGEFKAQIVAAQKDLEDYKTQIDTDPLYQGLSATEKMQELKLYEAKKMQGLFNENTPQWQKDAYFAATASQFGSVEQQMQTLNNSANAHNVAAKLISFDTDIVSMADDMGKNKDMTPEEAKNTIEVLSTNMLADINNTVMPSSARENMLGQLRQGLAKAEATYTKSRLSRD